mmetsp:Transcript_17586/g.26451  ORF Transcript_17586/g.26451 Transcript_17586/m.26451 type:complete len:252 (+) Transcript_17586:3-758(+)
MAEAKSMAYPNGLTVDFRHLSIESLRTYIVRHRLNVALDSMSHDELAVFVANHFAATPVDEESVLSRFFEALDKHASRDDDDEDNMEVIEYEEDDETAKPGEQVAAKITSLDENGSWILASVVALNRRTNTYQVQDEDDPTKLVELPAARIRRLENEELGYELQKGDRVLAIFPETTSFYRAIVSKTPKRNAQGLIYDVVLKFEDDEDDAGRTPHRRVAVRYVLREHDNYRRPQALPPPQGAAGPPITVAP